MAVAAILGAGCGGNDDPVTTVPVGPTDSTFGTPAPVDNSVANGNYNPANPAEPAP